MSPHTEWVKPLAWHRRPVAQTAMGTASRQHKQRQLAGDNGREWPALADDDRTHQAKPAEDKEEKEELSPQQASKAREDEENLGAYLADGSYGRLASEFASSMLRANGQRVIDGRQARSASSTTGKTPLVMVQPAPSSKLRNAIYRDQVYHFDGVDDALVVPPQVYETPSSNGGRNEPDSSAFSRRHTISFWMRHSKFKFKQQSSSSAANSTSDSQDMDELAKLSHHVREHLLCVSERVASSSDGGGNGPSARQHHNHKHHHHLNHYAIYMKNCKLNLLIRAGQLDDRPESPTEWRWSLDETGQFCDNKWHLYTVNVNHPQAVELFVDGQQFNNEKKFANNLADHHQHHSRSLKGVTDNADELDGRHEDRENLQHAATHSDLVLTVGACWDARSLSMIGHFRGSLSGLNLVANANTEANSIECLGRCTESLVSAEPLNDQQQQQQPPDNSLISYQEAQDRIQLRGHDLLDVGDALAQVAYVNKRQLPSVGKRSITLETQLSCSHLQASSQNFSTSQVQDGASQNSGFGSIQVEDLRVDVDVLPSTSLPVISLSGTPNLAREHLPFIQGKVLPFESLKVRVKQLNLLSPRVAPPSQSQSQLQAPESVPPQMPLSKRHRVSPSQVQTTKSAAMKASDLLDYIDDSTSDSQQQQPPVSIIDLEASENLQNTRRRIESCQVLVAGPPLDPVHENLRLPLESLQQLELYWRQSQAGAIIYGLDTAENYEALLRSIQYQNKQPSLFNERLFQLACSDMSGRLLSNDFTQRLTIIHPRPPSTGQPVHNKNGASSGAHLVQLLDARRYDSLRSGPPLPLVVGRSGVISEPLDGLLSNGLDQPPQLDNKLNRIALAFVVFAISALLIVLVIALTNLKETTENEAARLERRKRRLNRSRAARRSARDSHLLVRRRQLSTTPNQEEEPDREFMFQDCDRRYDNDDELLNSSGLSDEFSSEVQSEEEPGGGPEEAADAFDEQSSRGRPCGDGFARRACWPAMSRSKAEGAIMSPPSSIDMDSSLSWDDELNHQRHQHFSSASTTIVINPVVHGAIKSSERDFQLGGLDDSSKHSLNLVASIFSLNEKPQSKMVCSTPRLWMEEDSNKNFSNSSNNKTSHMVIDELIPMDEDMTSLCSRSRSCSMSSNGSHYEAMSISGGRQSESNWPEVDYDNNYQHHHECQHHEQFHFQHHYLQADCLPRPATCRHQEVLDELSTEGEEIDGDEFSSSNASPSVSYELYHRHHSHQLHHHHPHHHHHCLRSMREQQDQSLLQVNADLRQRRPVLSSSSSLESNRTLGAALTTATSSDSSSTSTIRDCD